MLRRLLCRIGWHGWGEAIPVYHSWIYVCSHCGCRKLIKD